LYGLTLSARRRVNYGHVAPKEAREIFVREALVEGHTLFRAGFLDHNRRLRKDVERIEAKIRRRDVLVDEQAIVDFYLERLPEQVHSIAALEKWLRHGGRTKESGGRPHGEQKAQAGSHTAGTRSLFATLGDFMRRDVPEATGQSHPDVLMVSGNRLPLEYRFEPGTPADGITVLVPEPLLNELSEARLSWLIPGWRLELVTELLRALPKAIRKSFVPVPEHAARAASEIDEDGSFYGAM